MSSISPFQPGYVPKQPRPKQFSISLYPLTPSSVRRTRNDEEFYGGFRRSSSLRRSGNTPTSKPRYAQDTFTSIVRRSRDRYLPENGTRRILPRPNCNNNNNNSKASYSSFSSSEDVKSLYSASPTSSNSSSLSSSSSSSSLSTSSASKPEYCNFNQYRRSNKPNVGLKNNNNNNNNNNNRVVGTYFRRHGSLYVPNNTYKPISSSKGYNKNDSDNSNDKNEDNNFLRTFSFRQKPSNDEDVTASLPCLNGNTPKNPTGTKQKFSNVSTLASSSLVLNSLAYQILPPSSSGSNSNSNNNNNKNDHITELPEPNRNLYSGGSLSGKSTTLSLTKSPPDSSRHPRDDSEGHLCYSPGDIIDNRYEVLSSLGEGTFGKVAKVKDIFTNENYALKIIKNVFKYREAARLEINVLKKLRKRDPLGKNLCVMMHNYFDHYGHICLTFEVLGESVFDFLKSNYFVPYPMEQVRHIAYQLCHAVRFMHDMKLTHTDLKPENILFVSNNWYGSSLSIRGKNKIIRRMRDSRVKLIDFGSATFEWEHHSSIVSTRHYRAPEVIMGIGWSHPCDVWSIGCIIFELFQGHTLFQTHNDREHLAMMERTLDKIIPAYLARKSGSKYFNPITAQLNWDSTRAEAVFTNQHCKTLDEHAKAPSIENTSMKLKTTMYDLIARTLEYDPAFRLTVQGALKHPFFDKPFYNDEQRFTSSSVLAKSDLSEKIMSLHI